MCGRHHGAPGLGRVSPIFTPPPPPIAPPGMGKVSPIFTPPPAPPVCGRYNGTPGLGKVSPIFTPPPPPPHSTACVCWYHGAPGLEKVSPIFTPPPPHSTAWHGKGVPNLHPPPPIAPPVCGRYHGAPGMGKVSPIFTPPPPQHRLCVAGIMGRDPGRSARWQLLGSPIISPWAGFQWSGLDKKYIQFSQNFHFFTSLLSYPNSTSNLPLDFFQSPIKNITFTRNNNLKNPRFPYLLILLVSHTWCARTKKSIFFFLLYSSERLSALY